MPFALASWANSPFQVSKPPGPLPHCAASAVALRHTSTATAANVTVISFLPLVIPTLLGGVTYEDGILTEMPCYRRVIAHLPRKTGFLRSLNASTPSRRSSVPTRRL